MKSGRGDQASVRIARGVAPFRKRRVVACLLQFEFHHSPPFGLDFHMFALGMQRGLNRHRGDRSRESLCNDFVRPAPAKTEYRGGSPHRRARLQR